MIKILSVSKSLSYFYVQVQVFKILKTCMQGLSSIRILLNILKNSAVSNFTNLWSPVPSLGSFRLACTTDATLPIGFLWAKVCECIRVVDLPSPALEPPSRPKQASLASLSIATCWPKMLWVYLAKSVSQCFLIVDVSSLNASLGLKKKKWFPQAQPEATKTMGMQLCHWPRACESIFLVVNLPSLR